jgi:archaemetzincin
MKRIIQLLKIGKIDPDILLVLKKRLSPVFKKSGIGVGILRDKYILDKSDFNLEREQYEASNILDGINMSFSDRPYFRILGVMDKDIYTKNYNFIFGISRLFSKSALISITRLRESFYEDSGLTYRKIKKNYNFDVNVLKEAIHELGHTFGLGHCLNYCIMQFSSCLRDTDNKPTKFCTSCIQKLKINDFSII